MFLVWDATFRVNSGRTWNTGPQSFDSLKVLVSSFCTLDSKMFDNGQEFSLNYSDFPGIGEN